MGSSNNKMGYKNKLTCKYISWYIYLWRWYRYIW